MARAVRKGRFKHLDWYLIANAGALFGVGLLTLFSATLSTGDRLTFMEKQLLAFLCGCLMVVAILFTDYHVLASYSKWMYGFVMAAIGLVFLVGALVGGAKRWIPVFGISLQPSEFVKPVLVLLIAQVIVQRRFATRALSVKDVMQPLLLMLLPVALIVLQPDLGTAIIIVLATLSMLWFTGLSMRVYAIFVLVGLISPSALWFYVLKPYQKERVFSFLRSLWETGSKSDPLGVDYHARQAIIAIGSGGFFGKGFMQGTQHMLRFVPEHHTDFIFTVFAEEWGFLGCAVLFLLFASLIWRITNVARRAGDELGSLIAIGLGSIIFFQFVINVLMTMHWAPVVGIPLPLFSYGGSSLVSMLVSVGILLNIGLRRYRY